MLSATKTRNFNQLKANDESLVSFEEVNENFVGLNEKSVMKDNLDMDKHRILNLAIPTGADEPATKQYADAHFLFQRWKSSNDRRFKHEQQPDKKPSYSKCRKSTSNKFLH